MTRRPETMLATGEDTLRTQFGVTDPERYAAGLPPLDAVTAESLRLQA